MSFPLASVNVHVTTVVPKIVIGKAVVVVPLIIAGSQLSVVVGVVGVPLHSKVSSAIVGVIGPVVSSIITF